MASTSMIGQDVRLALPPPASEPALPLELIELELSLDGFATEQDGFSEAVRRAAKSLDGEFLFDLPASGLAEDCQRVAALRIPEANGNGMKIVFALLDADGTGIRVEDPSEATSGLKNFADSFVGVLERMQ